MGEIADMMLDGTLCEGCGDYMGDDCGFTRLCAGCAKDRRADGHIVEHLDGFGHIDTGPAHKWKRTKPAPVAKVKCPTCGKKVKHNGLADHQRDAHK